jgi:hypothetical protein
MQNTQVPSPVLLQCWLYNLVSIAVAQIQIKEEKPLIYFTTQPVARTVVRLLCSKDEDDARPRSMDFVCSCEIQLMSSVQA